MIRNRIPLTRIVEDRVADAPVHRRSTSVSTFVLHASDARRADIIVPRAALVDAIRVAEMAWRGAAISTGGDDARSTAAAYRDAIDAIDAVVQLPALSMRVPLFSVPCPAADIASTYVAIRWKDLRDLSAALRRQARRCTGEPTAPPPIAASWCVVVENCLGALAEAACRRLRDLEILGDCAADRGAAPLDDDDDDDDDASIVVL